MKHMKRFLSKIFIAITCAVISFSAIAATNVPAGDIGDFGTFATEHNMKMFTDSLVGENGDLIYFQDSFQKQLVRDYVPPEARIGIAMMNALTHVAKILDASLVRFMVIFIIIMYLFWIMFEAYNFMQDGTANVKKLVTDLGKKAIWIIIWIAVLEIGPAKLFMYGMTPIVLTGTYIADFILNAIASVSGAILSDTCNAIHEYAAANTAPDMLIDANAAAVGGHPQLVPKFHEVLDIVAGKVGIAGGVFFQERPVGGVPPKAAAVERSADAAVLADIQGDEFVSGRWGEKAGRLPRDAAEKPVGAGSQQEFPRGKGHDAQNVVAAIVVPARERGKRAETVPVILQNPGR